MPVWARRLTGSMAAILLIPVATGAWGADGKAVGGSQQAVSALEWRQYDELMQKGMESYKAGQMAKADKEFSNALSIAERAGDGDGRLGACLNNLAAVYRAEDKLAQAEALYRRALATIEQSLGKGSPAAAMAIDNLIAVCEAQEKTGELDALYTQSMDIKGALYGKDSL